MIYSFDREFKNNDKLEIEKVFESENSKEILIKMPKNTTMSEHKAPKNIIVQVLKGWIWFEVDGKQMQLKALDMIALDANVPHSLGGIEDSLIRLTLHKDDSASRVKSVIGGFKTQN